MADPLILDIHTIFGPVPPRAATGDGIEPLQKLLEMHGVAGAVAVSSRGLYHSASAGNKETLALCAESGNTLQPAAVLDPRLPNASECVAGSRMLCIMPVTQNWPARFAPLTAALKTLAGRGVKVPIFWEATHLGIATEAQFALDASGYEGNVLFGTIYGDALIEAVTVARSSERFHIATNALRGVGAVGYAVEALGASRVVYGSGAMPRTLGGALGMVRTAGLSDDDLALVLGGNAKRMLSTGGTA